MHALISRIITAVLAPLLPARRPALAGPGGMTPEQLLAFHRRNFGDARMEAEADSSEDTNDTDGEEPPADNSSDYPENTPVKDMNPEQQVAYWKTQSRKWEGRAKGYDDVVAERDQLRQNAMSEAEKQVEAARNEGRLEGRTAASKEAATALFRQTLAARGKDAEAIETLQGMFNPAAYLDAKGALDHERLTKAIDTLAPAQQQDTNDQWPDMGQGKRREADRASVSAGRNLYDARHKQ